jgi:tripartite ATP-independent transporter DctP family solute receptor
MKLDSVFRRAGTYLIPACLTVALAAGLGDTAQAQKTLRLGHDQPTAHGYQEVGVYLNKRLSEITGGAYEVRIFPGAQLGNEMAMLDSVISGNLDMSVAAAANASTFVPELGMFSVSYIFANLDHFKRVLNDAAFNRLVDEKVAARKVGFRRVASFTAGVRNVYNNQGPIQSVDDLGGLKMRVMASPIESKVWGQLGTKPVAIPFGDVYTGMQTGLVQAAENAAAVYGSNKHYEVAPYYSMTGHQWLIAFLFVSDAAWAKWPDEVRTAVTAIGKEMTDHVIDFVVASDAKFVDELKEKYGVKVNAVDTQPFVKRLSPLQDEVAKDLGMEAVLARVRALQ